MPHLFTPGHQPWNKGKPVRLNPEHEFKKGDKPHNKRENGDTQVMNGRKYVKYNAKWLPVKYFERYVENLEKFVAVTIELTDEDITRINTEIIAFKEFIESL